METIGLNPISQRKPQVKSYRVYQKYIYSIPSPHSPTNFIVIFKKKKKKDQKINTCPNKTFLYVITQLSKGREISSNDKEKKNVARILSLVPTKQFCMLLHNMHFKGKRKQGPRFLSPTFIVMGQRALPPPLICFRPWRHKQAHPLVQGITGNHGHQHAAPWQESDDLNLLLQANSAHLHEIH